MSHDAHMTLSDNQYHDNDYNDIVTYWFIIFDDSIQEDDVGMSKLSHNGCLLEELHSVSSLGALVQSL